MVIATNCNYYNCAGMEIYLVRNSRAFGLDMSMDIFLKDKTVILI